VEGYQHDHLVLLAHDLWILVLSAMVAAMIMA
jgi:hypothetical protein